MMELPVPIPPPTEAAPPPPATAAPTLPSTDELKQLAAQALEEAKVKWEALWKEGQKYVKENPGKAVLGALGVGFVLGLIFKN